MLYIIPVKVKFIRATSLSFDENPLENYFANNTRQIHDNRKLFIVPGETPAMI